jgi:hypothetical protein
MKDINKVPLPPRLQALKPLAELNIVNGKMTTLDFAKLTRTRHNHVLEKARKLLKDLGFQPTEFSVGYLDAKNEAREMLELDRDLSLTLAGQYEPTFTKAIIEGLNRV